MHTGARFSGQIAFFDAIDAGASQDWPHFMFALIVPAAVCGVICCCLVSCCGIVSRFFVKPYLGIRSDVCILVMLRNLDN